MDSSGKRCPRHSTLPILLLCLSLRTHLCLTSENITANQSLSGNQTLTSSGGNFILGFFTPGNSPYSYLGIWYGKVSLQTVVWVANRDNPISDRYSSELKISGGNLVIINDSRVPAWTSNLTSSPTSSTMVAALGDDGNFALKDGPNTSNVLWQSFDHPTHTWLPGAKLGYNKRTNTSQLLTSWKNEDDPAAGLFSYQPTSTAEYFLYWNRSYKYWTSGPWDNQTESFSQVPEMRAKRFYDFQFVDNVNESYFTYSVQVSAPDYRISREVLDFSGQLKQSAWLPYSQKWSMFFSLPRQQCDVHKICGPFGVCSQSTDNFCHCLPGFSISSVRDWNLSDWSSGCKRNTNLNCAVTNTEKDRFFQSDNMKLPTDSQTLTIGSMAECETACLSNCSCTAIAFDNNGCQLWIGNLFNAEQLTQSDTSGKTLYLRLAASDVPGPSKKSEVTKIVIGSAGGALAIVTIFLFGIWRWKRRAIVKTKVVEGSLTAFAYRDLQVATKNFSEKLGGGGFGSVFKGILPDSTHIAVKMLDSISQGEKQFRTEVRTIGAIQHVNLVRLRGFCSDSNKRLLVYDYMPNGSLDVHLFNGKNFKCLDWKTRYQIALGIARGLAYLHEKCRDCIVHCDIKPQNILLDVEFCPHIADFGFAKLIGREFSRVLTSMRGTIGYLAPEWISGVAITVKADVYSYGMMLFEFISGRRNSEQAKDGMIKFFPAWAASKIIEGGDLLDLLDPLLERNVDVEELTRVCRVACWCIQDEEAHRPSMGRVVQILEGLLDVDVPEVPKDLQLLVDNQKHGFSFSESSFSNQNRSSKQLPSPVDE